MKLKSLENPNNWGHLCHLCRDIYAKGSGLLRSDSKEQFNERVEILLEEWDTL